MDEIHLAKGVYPSSVKESWWECPVWVMQTDFNDLFNKQLIDELHLIASNIQTGKDVNPGASLWDYPMPRLTELKSLIHKVVNTTCVSYLPATQKVEFRMLAGWLNVKEPGEVIETHAHPDASLAATYYVQADEGCGDLVLIDTGRVCSETLSIKRVSPRAGMLAFFPAYVLHRIEENKSSRLRISLSTDLGHTIDKDSPDAPVLKSWVGGMLKIKG